MKTKLPGKMRLSSRPHFRTSSPESLSDGRGSVRPHSESTLKTDFRNRVKQSSVPSDQDQRPGSQDTGSPPSNG
jgi:hypothetical protein